MFFVAFVFFALACSVPSLELADCKEARGVVRELYSFHFGNDMEPSMENIELRSKFLTNDFKQTLQGFYRAGEGAKVGDEFTKTVSDFPKAFRVGRCTLDESKNQAEFEVILFWKDDKRNDQRTLQVVTIKDSNKWLVNDIKLLPR